MILKAYIVGQGTTRVAVAARTSGKARYACLKAMQEANCHWTKFIDLTAKREPELDRWSMQQKPGRVITVEDATASSQSSKIEQGMLAI